MKILFIIDALGKGGKERRLVELVKGLSAYGDIVMQIVILYPLTDLPEINSYNVKIHTINRIVKKDPLVYFKLLKIVNRFKPDIINTWSLMPAVYGLPIAKLKGIRFVNSMIVNCPDKLDFHTKLFSSMTLPFSDIIVANSHAGLRAYNIRKNGMVIYNGYNFSRSENLTSADLLRSELNIKTRYTVGMVAVFRSQKDYKSLIIAANRICNERDDITFILVGDGPTLEENKKIAESERIIFAGKRGDVESIINLCDVGVLSTYTEGISNSILEFMAQGKPVIATDGGGTKEIVIEGETGFLVKRESPLMLKDKILQLINDDDLRKKMSMNSKKLIENKFRIERMVSDYYNLFISIQNRR